MNIKKIFEKIFYTLLVVGSLALLIHYALKSDFANMKSIPTDKNHGIKVKARYAKSLRYDTKFKRDKNNDSILSLGDFTVNVSSANGSAKLIMKVSIDTNEDTIDEIIKNQSVIRGDVIKSVRNLDTLNINQEDLANEIKNNLNSRFKVNNINDVYFEKFLLH